MGIVFSFIFAFDLLGFVYALVEAACEFLYFRNNKYYDMKINNKIIIFTKKLNPRIEMLVVTNCQIKEIPKSSIFIGRNKQSV